MLWNGAIKLRTITESTDSYGDITQTVTSKEILADISSVGRNEFYSAQTAGFNPQIIFNIRKILYGNENEIEYNGEVYTVIRTYSKDNEILELICKKGVR